MKLQLIYPLKQVQITQVFGETAYVDWYKKNGITFTGHDGIDFYAVHGTPILATHDGYAHYEIDRKGGHGVVIRSDKQYEYYGKEVYFKTIYWHLVDSTLDKQYKSPVEGYTGLGKELFVKQGDIIGYADNTGLSGGSHLHYALKPCDQYATNLEPNNGYYGCINPTPYFDRRRFNEDINYGDYGEEVVYLQNLLVKYGYMNPVHSSESGYYGKKTKEAVYKFQVACAVASRWTLYWNGGRYVGPATRYALNLL